MDANNSASRWPVLVYGGLAVFVTALIVTLTASIVLSSPHYVKIDGWISTTPLPQALANRNAIVQGDYLYFVGGKSAGDAPIGSIFAAHILDNGTLGSWTVAGALPLAVYLHAIAATDTDLYVIGGWDGSQTRTEVWRAPFVANGGLGGFVKVSDYPVGIDLHDAAIVQNRLYVFGGWTGRDPLSTVRFADILPGGLGPWQTTSALPRALYRLSAATFNDRVYITGGFDSAAARSEVYVATVLPGGGLTAWEPVTPLPNGLFFHETVIHDDQLLVLGGRNISNEFSNVYAAPIIADGSLGAWLPQTNLPESLHRFSAVTVTRNDSDYVYIMGGLHGVDYRNTVSHSTYPLPPTPTSTPTLTPTPTPRPETLVDVTLHNEPQRWIGPGEEVEYTVTYANGSAIDLADVEIVNLVPPHVELIPESIQVSTPGSYTYTATAPGSAIRWSIGSLAADGAGQVSFRVRRPTPAPPAIPRVLAIDVTGPARSTAGAPITYSIVLTNNTAFPLTNLAIVAGLPLGAAYLSGGDTGPENDKLAWIVPALEGDETIQRQFVVTANHSLVLYDYYVASDEGPTAKGQRVLTTQVGDTDPPPPGDGVLIANTGATLTWQSGGQSFNSASNPVYNPTYGIYLPLVGR